MGGRCALTQKVAVLLIEQDGHWAARAADVLDVYAFGATKEDACKQLERGIAAHFHALQAQGLPVPAFSARVGVTATDLLEGK